MKSKVVNRMTRIKQYIAGKPATSRSLSLPKSALIRPSLLSSAFRCPSLPLSAFNCPSLLHAAFSAPLCLRLLSI